MLTDKEREEMDRERVKSRFMMIMTRHIGKAQAIGMGELYSAVFGKPWHNRINDTRAVRKLVEELRRGTDGLPQPIASDNSGYYIATGNELDDYIKERLVQPALKKLGLAATLRKKALPELLGQLAIDFQPE